MSETVGHYTSRPLTPEERVDHNKAQIEKLRRVVEENALPETGAPVSPSRWERIQERGMNDIVIHLCLHAMKLGALDKEAALEVMVLSLSKALEESRGAHLKALQEMPPPIILAGDKAMIHKKTEEALISVGWLPPCEGRKVLTGKFHHQTQGSLMVVGLHRLDDELIEYQDRPVRLILDPLPKEGEA